MCLSKSVIEDSSTIAKVWLKLNLVTVKKLWKSDKQEKKKHLAYLNLVMFLPLPEVYI